MDIEIYRNINKIIKLQNITKKVFVNKFLGLEPKLKSTGEVPTEATVYKYLNGTLSIKIELVSYIAEALRVTEQELFFSSYDKRISFYKTMIASATHEEVQMIKERLKLKDKLQDIIEPNEDIENLIDPLIDKLEKFKNYIK